MWSQGPATSTTAGGPLGPPVSTSGSVGLPDTRSEGRPQDGSGVGGGGIAARGGGSSTGGGEEGKCVCNICHKSFPKISQLRMHVNIHYFERPFRCDACAVSFRTRGHLQKHKRSVSHYNRVNMNLTFGTPTADNPRPFKCDDCKIAFRIHGHLAKHLRSKMHIMKLECLGKLPFGMYAELERSGINLNEIDTTDCENSLESLQVLAQRLYQQEACSLRWKEAGGSGEGGGGSSEPEDDGLETPLPPLQQALGTASADMAGPQSIDAINEHTSTMQAIRQPSPQHHHHHTYPSRMDSQPTPPVTSIPNQLSRHHHMNHHSLMPSVGGSAQPATMQPLQDPQGSRGPQMSSHPRLGGLGPPHEYLDSSQQHQMMPQQNLVNPLMLNNMLHQQQHQMGLGPPHGPSSAPPAVALHQHHHHGMVSPQAPSTGQGLLTGTSQAPPDAPRSSCTCHICGKVLKSAKSLQVHLHTEHTDEQSKTPAPSVAPGNSGVHGTQGYVPLASHPSPPTQPAPPPPPQPPNDMMQQHHDSGLAGCHLCNKSFQNHILLQQVSLHISF